MAQSLLMCPPDYYGVHYIINPWMTNKIGKVDQDRAQKQWIDFHSSLLELIDDVELISPEPHLPDLVFTANAGLMHGNKCVLSRFRYAERRPEEACFRTWFQANGYELVEMDKSIHFEGAGDALFQPGQDLLWASYGFRSDLEAHEILAREFRVRVISLKLVDPRFYHLDTCFCPLLEGGVMYYPDAFDEESRKLIEENTLPENRIVVATEDAIEFACNAVLVEKTILLHHASQDLTRQLENAGYSVCVKPLTEFIKAGGANKCLTLELHVPPQANKIQSAA